MEPNDINNYRGRGSRIWSGFILVCVGVVLLAYKMGAPIPGWVFTWPVLLIAIGFLVGIKSRFRNPGAFIMILIGGIFLIDQSVPGINFHNYILPVILIGVGILYILRPSHTHCRRRSRYWNNIPPNAASSTNKFERYDQPLQDDNAEYLDTQAIFGSIKKNILSKNFKGGEIVSFMGGTEINLMQADIQQSIVLEINNVFGGTKLIIPSNWDVKNEVTAVFGGIEDKRTFDNIIPDSGKNILLKGACIFGGIEITNY